MLLKDYPQKFKWKDTQKGTFGLEIETEVPDSQSYPQGLIKEHYDEEHDKYVFDIWDGYWRAEKDGSLRNYGVEFILDKPLKFKELLKSIDEFVEKTSGIDFIEDAPGTSVHVHVNMQEEDVMTIFSYVTLWTLFENVLTEYSGEFRRSNLYAIPSRVADGVLMQYINMMKTYVSGNNAFYASEGSSKYAALNIAPLNTLGTIEIRTLRGTTSGDILKEWCTILNDLLLYSRGKTPEDIFRRYHVLGAEGMIKEVFSSYQFLSSIDNIIPRIEDAEIRVFRIAKCVDWREAREKTFEKPEKKLKPKPHTITFDEHQDVVAQFMEFVSPLTMQPIGTGTIYEEEIE